MVSEVDPPVSPDRIGAAFGLPDVSVRSSTGLQGSGGTHTLWEYRTDADGGFRVGLVVAAFPSRDGDLADFVRGAAGFTGPAVVPLRPLTGIADHAAIYRTQQCVGVAAASRRGRDIVAVVMNVEVEAASDGVLVELATEAFANSWGGS